jgi:hypothetical protein
MNQNQTFQLAEEFLGRMAEVSEPNAPSASEALVRMEDAPRGGKPCPTAYRPC